MNGFNAASLVNILGFTVGTALYALLAIMAVRHRKGSPNWLLLVTAALGFLWNIAELFVLIQRDFSGETISPFLIAASYSALGFLPSAVVHSAQIGGRRAKWFSIAAYFLSAVAAFLHFYSAIDFAIAPSYIALMILTAGAATLAVGLLIANFREVSERKAVLAAALLVFAVSALHLSGTREGNSWVVELVAHQSSLPLVLVILYQNYKFAFADLFLKRAISLVLLALVAFGLYTFVAAPLLRYHETHDRNDTLAISLILTLWIATALIYPRLHDLAVWLVDRVILHRTDYAELQSHIAIELEKIESTDECLNFVGAELARSLTADKLAVTMAAANDLDDIADDRAEITIPTAESPYYRMLLSGFRGGRRLLSEEKAMIAAAALVTARRIDSLRVSHERYEREFREQEFSRLAAEAQLTALRSQINPHFLFNALTTIGYLIRTSPEKALQTLLHLTKLLRGVLTTASEFSTLRDELDLIESYLDIERARFEERLEVEIDVPAELEGIKIPSLVIQPLVENAIKHAISENKSGGKVTIGARLADASVPDLLVLTVTDTGAGKLEAQTDSTGTGLNNIRERLSVYYGDKAMLMIETSAGGTVATVTIPTKITGIENNLRAA